jgi:hypothetical protein
MRIDLDQDDGVEQQVDAFSSTSVTHELSEVVCH